MDDLPVVGNPFVVQLRQGVQDYICPHVDSIGQAFLQKGVTIAVPSIAAYKFIYCNSGQPPPGSLTETLPFTGGQCPGVLYTAEVNIVNQTFNNTVTIQNLLGPIDSLVVNPAAPASSRLLYSRNGDPTLLPVDGSGTAPSGNPTLSYTFVQPFSRQDSLPDTCGDPEGTPPRLSGGISRGPSRTRFRDCPRNQHKIDPRPGWGRFI